MRYTIIASALMTTLLASACSGEGARSLDGAAAQIYGGECADGNGRSVTVYAGRSENLIGPPLEAFACETGTAVETRWGSSTDLALLLAEEGDRTVADVFLSRSPGPVGFLESQGLLGAVDGDVLGLVAEQNRSKSGTWVGFSGRKRVLVHNLDSVPSDELPQSVFDLTGERYRDRVAIRPPTAPFSTGSPCSATSTALTPPPSGWTKWWLTAPATTPTTDPLWRPQPGRDRHGPSQPLLPVPGGRRGGRQPPGRQPQLRR